MIRPAIFLGIALLACVSLYVGACIPADFSFADAPDSGAEASSVGTCDPDASFGAPERDPFLSSGAEDGNARLTANELTVYLYSKRQDPNTAWIYRATRPTKEAHWSVPQPVNELNVLAPINYGPTPRGDDGQLFFEIDQPGDGGTEKRIWSALRTTPTTFASPAKSALRVGQANLCPYALPDGSKLYFTVQDQTIYDFYSASVENGEFVNPTRIDALSEGGAWQLCPTVTPDEKTIYFASTRSAPSQVYFQSFDIWMSRRRDREANWETPTRVDSVSEYGIAEIPSWISPDGCTLYLQKSASPTAPTNIYVARKPRK